MSMIVVNSDVIFSSVDVVVLFGVFDVYFLFYFSVLFFFFFFFFFQAEDGIRDVAVTGVQTCALPILHHIAILQSNALTETQAVCAEEMHMNVTGTAVGFVLKMMMFDILQAVARSEERRVGKECRCRWARSD